MSEEEERELDDAEAAFRDEGQREAEDNMQILTALGFTPYYHDKDPEGNDETNFGIRVMKMKIGVKFNDKNPAGKIWAYVLTDDNKKDIIKNGSLKELPLVQRYLDIQAGKKPIPEATVTGRITERRGKGIEIEIEEDGEKKRIFFGLGAVKRHDDGRHFIPHGFSKPSSDNPDGKMCVPRDILLLDMDPQPTLGTPTEAEQKREKQIDEAEKLQQNSKGAAWKIEREEQGRAPVATTIPVPATEAAPAQPPATKPTQAELITKYVELLAAVTEAIEKEDRIPEREKGYGIKFVYYSVKHTLENGKNGGSQEEA